MPLSQAALRRLDELCEEWARWYCDRWVDRPGLDSQTFGGPDTGRQWRETYELNDEYLKSQSERVNMAIDNLPDQHRRVLHAWAWENHYNRGVIRRVEKTDTGLRVFTSNRANVTPEALIEAQTALVPFLGWHNVELPA